MENQSVVVSDISNREFLERHAQAGRVGLCGGMTRVDTAIRRAQRHQHAEGRWSDWSHVFLFEGRRLDGHDWVLDPISRFIGNISNLARKKIAPPSILMKKSFRRSPCWILDSTKPRSRPCCAKAWNSLPIANAIPSAN